MLPEKHSPLQEVSIKQTDVRLIIKRDDLLHPTISGNKWRKLKYNLIEMRTQKKETLLTFGGAFSNHIAATAAAGKKYHFKTIGIIRGERPKGLNTTLNFAESCGMDLHFISRSDYRRKNEPELIASLKERFGDFYSLPEGGTNCLALEGCAEIVTETKSKISPDYWCIASGTGGTISGMIKGLNNQSQVLGFSALKGDFLKDEVSNLLENCQQKNYSNWQMNTDYHFGGYAKFKPELIEFINRFSADYAIPLDPIYTGKMFYGIFDLLKKGYFSKGSTILAVHTGGLQGIEGFNARFGDLIHAI